MTIQCKVLWKTTCLNTSGFSTVFSDAPARTFSFKPPWEQRPPTSILVLFGKLNVDPIDNVSRDGKDLTRVAATLSGKLHFTRRSNLRRHFQTRKYRKLRSIYPANNLSDLPGTYLPEVCNEEHNTKYCFSYNLNMSDRLLYLFLSARTAFRTT